MPTPAPTPTPVAAAIPIGTNFSLYSNSYFGQSYPFLDRYKTASTWQGRNGDFSPNGNPVPVDANGWPTGLASGSVDTTCIVNLEPAVEGQLMTYRMRYTGVTPYIGSATVTSSSAGEIFFTYTGVDGTAQMATSGATSLVTIVRTDQIALFDAGVEIFNPAFLAINAPWSILRPMEWGLTNGSTVTTWASRTKITDATWGNAVPLEVLIKLCNKLRVPYWVNTPHQGVDDYIENEAELIRDTLDSDLRVFSEWSNEVWNGGFAQTSWAAALWVSLFGADGAAALKGAGYRAAQHADIYNTVFAATPERLTTVLGTQTANVNVSTNKEIGILAAGLGTVRDLFPTLGLTLYFGDSLTGFNAPDRATILGWAADGATGLTAAFNEIENGGTLTAGDSSVNNLFTNYLPPQIAWAAARNMDLVVYEGPGWHVTTFNTFTDPGESAAAVAFHSTIAADARMGVIYADVTTAALDLGFQAIATYADIGSPGIFGVWGIQTSPYRAETQRYAAMKALALAPPAIPALSITGTPPPAWIGKTTPFTPVVSGGVIPRTAVLTGTAPLARTFDGISETGTYTTAAAYAYSYDVTDRAGSTDSLPVAITVTATEPFAFEAFNVSAFSTSYNGGTGKSRRMVLEMPAFNTFGASAAVDIWIADDGGSSIRLQLQNSGGSLISRIVISGAGYTVNLGIAPSDPIDIEVTIPVAPGGTTAIIEVLNNGVSLNPTDFNLYPAPIVYAAASLYTAYAAGGAVIDRIAGTAS